MGGHAASEAVERELLHMLRSLAHPDAAVIFSGCAHGLKASTDEGDRLGLSRKRYYSRLRALVDSGLVRKVERRYEHTPFGELLFETLWRGEMVADAGVAT